MTAPDPASSSSAASPVSLSVHGLPTPRVGTDARTRAGRLKMLLVLLMCATPVIASYFTYYVIRPGARTNYGALIEPMRPIPPATTLPLQDAQGRAVDPASLRGQWLLLMVGDGGCDSDCERLLYAQRQLREGLGREKDRVDRVWLVTGTTPIRPELLPALTQATVLRAPFEAVANWLTPAPGESLAAHLYLVDPMGNWMMRFPAQFDPAKVRRDLDRMLRASASWDRSGREPALPR